MIASNLHLALNTNCCAHGAISFSPCCVIFSLFVLVRDTNPCRPSLLIYPKRSFINHIHIHVRTLYIYNRVTRSEHFLILLMLGGLLCQLRYQSCPASLLTKMWDKNNNNGLFALLSFPSRRRHDSFRLSLYAHIHLLTVVRRQQHILKNK